MYVDDSNHTIIGSRIVTALMFGGFCSINWQFKQAGLLYILQKFAFSRAH
jgi:hypothetical protein